MSKIALISDVHGNYPALEAVIKELEQENPDLWICLGDLVGYGPHPAEVIDEVISRKILCVMGNHDAGVTRALSLDHFRYPNKRLLKLTRNKLSGEHLEWLRNLPLTIKSNDNSWIAAHASPVEPENWEYLNSAIRIREILEDIESDFCFTGHTHIPGLVSDTIGMNTLKKGHKYFINPGSVGQPRDGDWRASCGILDIKKLTYKNIRVSYNINPVIADLENMGFSASEAERLIVYR